MKRAIHLAVLATLVSACCALAQEEAAYSVNAIGAIKKTVPANGLAFLTLPLDDAEDIGTGTPVCHLPAISNMPNGSAIQFWDPVAQQWVAQTKFRNNWGTQKDRLVQKGEAFFLKNNQATNLVLTFYGEVPVDSSMSVGLVSDGFSASGNPFPVDAPLSDLTFAAEAANGSVVQFWDVDTQQWVAQTKFRNSWGTQASRGIKAGEGFFVKSVGQAIEWTEARPYTWPAE